MKRLFTTIAVLAVLTVGLMTVHSAQALDFVMTKEHEQRIRQNCVAAQATLYQLHASDALLRVNRGKLYENISNRLMAPLNSRIALNRHEGLQLAATTVEYDRQLDVFRNSYKTYEEAMSRTLDVKCVDNPVKFYENVISTREKRKQLHEDTKSLTRLLNTYKNEFEEFAGKHGGGK